MNLTAAATHPTPGRPGPFRNMDRTPIIYGYARVSTDEQVASNDTQTSLILKRAQEIAVQENCSVGPCLCEIESAVKTSHEDRPVFQRLMKLMLPGDHLVVWHLNRLERSLFRAAKLGQWLVDRGILLHVLEQGGMTFDLDSDTGQIVFMLMSWCAGQQGRQIGSMTKDALHFLRDNAYAYTRVPFGFRIKPLPLAPGREKPLKIVVPCKSTENGVNVGGAIVDEIVRRIDQGDVPYHVAKDLAARRCRCHDRPWAPKRRDGCVDMRKVMRAYRYWKWYQGIASACASSAVSPSVAFQLPRPVRLSLEQSEQPKQLTCLAASTPEILCQP